MTASVALVALLVLGVVEAVLYFHRIRHAVGDDAVRSALYTLCTCATSGAKMLSVFVAARDEAGLIGAVVVYPLSAALSTWWVQSRTRPTARAG